MDRSWSRFYVMGFQVWVGIKLIRESETDVDIPFLC